MLDKIISYQILQQNQNQNQNETNPVDIIPLKKTDFQTLRQLSNYQIQFLKFQDNESDQNQKINPISLQNQTTNQKSNYRQYKVIIQDQKQISDTIKKKAQDILNDTDSYLWQDNDRFIDENESLDENDLYHRQEKDIFIEKDVNSGVDVHDDDDDRDKNDYDNNTYISNHRNNSFEDDNNSFDDDNYDQQDNDNQQNETEEVKVNNENNIYNKKNDNEQVVKKKGVEKGAIRGSYKKKSEEQKLLGNFNKNKEEIKAKSEQFPYVESYQQNGVFGFFCCLCSQYGGTTLWSDPAKPFNSKKLIRDLIIHDSSQQHIDFLTQKKQLKNQTSLQQYYKPQNKFKKDHIFYQSIIKTYSLHFLCNYFPLIKGYALSCTQDVIEIIESCGIRLDNNYKSSFSNKKIVSAIVKTIKKSIIHDIQNSPFLSFQIDSSKDVTHNELLFLIIRYLDQKGGVKEIFLDLINLPRKTSQAIFDAVKTILEQYKIWGKMTFVCTDGENSMSGNQRGFAALYEAEAPWKKHIICVNHKENTGLKHIYQNVQKLKAFHIFTNELIVFLRSSFKIVRLFREVQQFEKESNKYLNMVHGTDVKWSYYCQSVTRIKVLLPEIISTMNQISQQQNIAFQFDFDKHQINKAKYYQQNLLDYENLFFIHFLTDFLSPLDIMSKGLQTRLSSISDLIYYINYVRQYMVNRHDQNCEINSYPNEDEPDFNKKIHELIPWTGLNTQDLLNQIEFTKMVFDSGKEYIQYSYKCEAYDYEQNAKKINFHKGKILKIEFTALNYSIKRMVFEINLCLDSILSNPEFEIFDVINLENILKLNTQNQIKEYGIQKMEKIIELLKKMQINDILKPKTQIIEDQIEIIPLQNRQFNFENIKNEWLDFKIIFFDKFKKLYDEKIDNNGSYENFENEIDIFLRQNEPIYENIIKLVKFYKIIPISNAEIERAFSSLKFIKNLLRNRLEDDNLSNILFVYKLKINIQDFKINHLENSIKQWTDDNPGLRFI